MYPVFFFVKSIVCLCQTHPVCGHHSPKLVGNKTSICDLNWKITSQSNDSYILNSIYRPYARAHVKEISVVKIVTFYNPIQLCFQKTWKITVTGVWNLNSSSHKKIQIKVKIFSKMATNRSEVERLMASYHTSLLPSLFGLGAWAIVLVSLAGLTLWWPPSTHIIRSCYNQPIKKRCKKFGYTNDEKWAISSLRMISLEDYQSLRFVPLDWIHPKSPRQRACH